MTKNQFLKQDYRIKFLTEEITPSREVVLESIGIKDGVPVPPEIDYLYSEASNLFFELVSVQALLAPIEKDEFASILKGKGLNDCSIPLEEILERAEHLALFVCTLGPEISLKIQVLMKNKDYPMAHMLDTIASRSAENATEVAEEFFQKEIEKKLAFRNRKVLLYSPGYCGWHITAQKKIFNYLSPEKIGVSLTDSSLMQPIKSVSGILISGERDIHKFRMIFPFCKNCQTFSCRERIKK
jgi:hypothetical protein